MYFYLKCIKIIFFNIITSKSWRTLKKINLIFFKNKYILKIHLKSKATEPSSKIFHLQRNQ